MESFTFSPVQTKENVNYSLNWEKKLDNYSLENQTLFLTRKHGVKRNNPETAEIFFPQNQHEINYLTLMRYKVFLEINILISKCHISPYNINSKLTRGYEN